MPKPPSPGTLASLTLVVVTLLSISCEVAPDTEESDGCYAVMDDQVIDPDTPWEDIPFCAWTHGTLPAPPPGYAFTHAVSARFDISAEQPCDPCDVERLDALLEQSIEDRGGCSAMDYQGPRRGCIIIADGECWIGGVYFSNHEVTPVEDGC